MKKILITGNLGYVGSELSKFISKFYEFIGYDIGFFEMNITNKNYKNYLKKQYYGDIRNFDEKILIKEKIDSVIHLAAISNDPIGNRFEEQTNEINYVATKNLAKICKNIGVRNFVFASSCSIYGKNKNSDICDENAKLNPLTAYAQSKVDSEIFLSSISDDNFLVTSLRFATACGDSDRLRLDLVLNDFVASACLNKKIEILSNGMAYRPLINTSDMSKSLIWAANRNNDFGNYLSLNVGRNNWNYNILELGKQIKEICEVDLSSNENALSDSRSYSVDFSKFKKVSNLFNEDINLDRTIIKLKDKIQSISPVLPNDFRNSPYIRLNTLESLINQKKIDNKLFLLNEQNS